MNMRKLVEVAGDRLLGRTVWTEPPGAPEEFIVPAEDAAGGAHERIRTLIADDSAVWFIPKERLRDELPGVISQLFSRRAGGAEGARP